jgi:hypothetical protein
MKKLSSLGIVLMAANNASAGETSRHFRPVISGPAGGGAKSSGAIAAPGEPLVTSR